MRCSFVLAVALCACGNATPPAQTAPSPSAANAPPPEAAAPVATAEASPSAAPSAADSTAAASPEADAQHAAEAWLAVIDAGKYAESWTETAAMFRAAMDQPGWTKALNTVRSPLGSLKSRALRSAHYTKSLPGVPDGEYVVVQFDTAFDKKQAAVETVTPMKEADGHWRVSGYFIK